MLNEEGLRLKFQNIPGCPFYRVRNSWGRVSNLPLLLAEEGSQITTFGGRRVPNFSFLTQNFWREKGLKSQQIGGRRVSNEDFTPLKVAV